MKVRYIGPFRPGGFVPLGPFDGVEIEYGAVGDVPDDIGAGLILQATNWESAEDAPPAPPGTTDPPAEDTPPAGKTKKGGGD